jgi:hypothetical protein
MRRASRVQNAIAASLQHQAKDGASRTELLQLTKRAQSERGALQS